MNKKLFLFIIIGVFAIILGFLLSQKNQPQQTKQTPVIRVAASPPSTQFVSDEPSDVIFSYQGDPVSIPDSLPVFPYTQEQTLKSVPTALGFLSPPITKSAGAQSITVWNDTGKELSLFSNNKTNNWSYSAAPSLSESQKILSPMDAKLFIEGLFSLPPMGSLVFIKESTGPFDGYIPPNSQSSPIKNYTFSFLLNNTYLVVDATFNSITASLLVDQEGFLHSFSFTSPATILTEDPSSQKRVLLLEEAVQSLNNNRGRLISAGTGEDDDAFWGEPPTFTEVSLTRASLVYYPREETGFLTPFFLFKGSATNTEKTVLVVEYAVSAIE